MITENDNLIIPEYIKNMSIDELRLAREQLYKEIMGDKNMTKDINNTSKETQYQSSFNSGVKYGYGKGIKTKIDTLEPHPTEVIVVQFNFNDFTPYEINNIHDALANKFPNNTVVIIPDKASLQSCSKDVLENYISMIAEIIEEL